MDINGLIKLTLLDFPGKTACTVFLAGCNLRCPFCHNASLVTRAPESEITAAEVYAFLEKRTGLLDGVCITGGEPLINKEVFELMRGIRARGFAVKLDTNGFFPEALARVLSEGLADYVAMDIKSSPEGYAAATGIPDIDITPVRESIALLMSGKTDFEFRTTAVKGLHTKKDFEGIADMIAGEEKYFIQRFVDSGDLIGGGYSAFSPEEEWEILQAVRTRVKNAFLRGV